ncbi:MAG: acyl-CoA/acyl-ACP dehydrogenase, partial [Proteobacteria bacterium]|nr:acyl-CoA/acyl-ACP dehydrogenase [Pseudomonadota bacterium]
MNTMAQAQQQADRAPTVGTNAARSVDGAEMLRAARQIAQEVAALHASDVDAKARFPQETIDALKAARLLSAPLPVDRGGAGLGLQQLGAIVSALAEGCASSAMVLAMHYSQLGCLQRHGGHHAEINAFIRELALKQWLVASITSEVGTAGDTRRSICAVDANGDQLLVEKNGTTGSYCEEADAILVTARAGADAAENDQVLALVRRGEYELTRTTAWDTLGMRGTCSPGVKLRATASRGQILPVPFADISALTMVPYA